MYSRLTTTQYNNSEYRDQQQDDQESVGNKFPGIKGVNRYATTNSDLEVNSDMISGDRITADIIRRNKYSPMQSMHDSANISRNPKK